MKRILFSSMASLALTAGWQSVFAAEVQPAPERATRERPAWAEPSAGSLRPWPSTLSHWPAPAREVVVQAAPVQPVQSWSGTEVGVFAAGNITANNFAESGANQFFRTVFDSCPPDGCFVTLPPGAPNGETPFSFSGHPRSFTGGLFLGYNLQIGMHVWGVEGDIAFKKADTSTALGTLTMATYMPVDTGVSATRTEAFTGHIKQNWDASFRLRYGILLTPDLLVYITGGIAFDNVSGSFSYAAQTDYISAGAVLFTDATGGAGSWNEIRVGGTVGVGAETNLFSPWWKLRAEYRWTQFSPFGEDVLLFRNCTPGAFGIDCPTPNFGSTNAHIDLRTSFQTFRLGIGRLYLPVS